MAVARIAVRMAPTGTNGRKPPSDDLQKINHTRTRDGMLDKNIYVYQLFKPSLIIFNNTAAQYRYLNNGTSNEDQRDD
jgi:hypothetical protein